MKQAYWGSLKSFPAFHFFFVVTSLCCMGPLWIHLTLQTDVGLSCRYLPARIHFYPSVKRTAKFLISELTESWSSMETDSLILWLQTFRLAGARFHVFSLFPVKQLQLRLFFMVHLHVDRCLNCAVGSKFVVVKSLTWGPVAEHDCKILMRKSKWSWIPFSAKIKYL